VKSSNKTITATRSIFFFS